MKRFAEIIFSLILLLVLVWAPRVLYAGNPPDQSKSTITGTYAPADGSTPSWVTIALRDGSGTALTSNDSILITSSDTTTSFNPSSATLDGSGVLYTKMKSSRVGYVPITVNDTTTRTLISGSIYFYTPGGIPPSSGSCTDPPPGSTVQLLSAVSAGDNAVTLTWVGASNPVTYYLVSFGVSSGNYMYGNPNVGGQGTTSYTVGSLTTGTKYYFVVRAGNGCTPGAYSNELSATAGGSPSPTVTPAPTPTSTPTPAPTIRQSMTPPVPTATPVPTQIPNASGAAPIVTQAPEPIETFPPLPQQSAGSPAQTVVIIGVVAGILIFAGVGVWLYIERKNQNRPPPIADY